MTLTDLEHAALNRLCEDKSSRIYVMEHVLIGLRRGKVNGLYVHLPEIQQIFDLYQHIEKQLDDS